MKLKPKYRYLVLVLLLALATTSAFALKVKPIDKWLQEGNKHYSKAQYAAAIESYRRAVDAGINSAAVFYNLGNAYYKNGDIAWSVLYYEKARKLAPNDEDINVNLQFARLKTVDKLNTAPQFFLSRWWQNLILIMPLQTLAVLSVILILLASGAFIYYLFAGSVSAKKASFYSGLSLLAVGLLFWFLGNRQSNYFQNNKEAVIFSPTVSAKSAPSSAAKNLFVLHDGTKVTIAGRNEQWLKIRMPNGNEGWIQVADAKEI